MSMISSIKVLNFDKKNRKSFWVLPYACVSDTTHLDFQATIMFPILRVDFRFCFPKLISTAIRSISMARSIDVHQMIENQWGYALFHYALRIRRIAIFAGPDKFSPPLLLASVARNRFFGINLSMVLTPHRLKRYTMGDCYVAFALCLRWNVLTLRDIWTRNILAGACPRSIRSMFVTRCICVSIRIPSAKIRTKMPCRHVFVKNNVTYMHFSFIFLAASPFSITFSIPLLPSSCFFVTLVPKHRDKSKARLAYGT